MGIISCAQVIYRRDVDVRFARPLGWFYLAERTADAS